MSIFLYHEQIDLATGDCLGGDIAGWAGQISQRIGTDAAQDQASPNYLSTDDPSKLKLTFHKFAGYFQSLVLACSSNSILGSDELQTLKVECADMIHDLRLVHRDVWTNFQWKLCLRDSGFISAFWELQYIYIHPHFHIPAILLPLWRQCQIFDSICCLLLIWFKDDLDTTSSNLSNDGLWPQPCLPNHTTNFFHTTSEKALVDILLTFPTMIPLHTDPSSVYFLTSQENFWEAYNNWLRVALVLRGVKARLYFFKCINYSLLLG
jgi:hypothetical protein